MNKDIEIEVKEKIVKEFGSFDRRVHMAIQLTQQKEAQIEINFLERLLDRRSIKIHIRRRITELKKKQGVK